MFEKEAEEYAKQNNPAEYGVRATHFTVLNSFKDGAEFGYNKANEWHKESPKVSMPLILIRYRCHVDNEIYVALGKYDADYGGNKFQSDYWNVFDDEVIAWKEIVLPKEIKENDKEN